MRIAFITEAAGPPLLRPGCAWCDGLLLGMPEHRVELTALTPGDAAGWWRAPPAPVAPRTIASCSPDPRVRSWSREGRRAADRLNLELLTPLPEQRGAADAQLRAFEGALEAVAREVQERGATAGLLTSDRAIDFLVTAWERRVGTPLTLRDALEWGTLLEHLLQPLAAPVVEADVVHAWMNGPSMLVAMLARWLRGTPVVLSERESYLRERYQQDEMMEAGPRVAFLHLNFQRLLTAVSYRVADMIASHSRDSWRWQVASGADPGRMRPMHDLPLTDGIPVVAGRPHLPTVLLDDGRRDGMGRAALERHAVERWAQSYGNVDDEIVRRPQRADSHPGRPPETVPGPGIPAGAVPA